MNDAALVVRLQDAHARLQRGDLAGARAAIAPVTGGGDVRVLHLAAMIERAAGDLGAARNLFERAVATGKATAELRNSYGNLLADLGDLDAADREYAAAGAQPGYADPWINRGRLASRRGRHDEAEAHLKRAVALAPQSALARITLGNAHRDAGRHDDAIRELEAARRLEPARQSTALHLGIALTAADRAAEAVEVYDAAERAGNASPELVHNRSAALIALGELDRARAELDRLVARHPTYLAGHRDRARLIWEFGLDGDPFESFAALARQFPSEPVVREQWANALAGFRQFEAAARVAAEGRRAVGDAPGLLRVEAAALSEIGELDAADAAFARAAGPLARDGDFHATHARHRLRRRQPEAAVAAAEAALALNRHDQLALAYLGLAWRMLDDPREFWLHDYDRHTAKIAAIDQHAVETAAAALRKLHITRVHPADQSLRNGTQTPGALFQRPEPEIAGIREAVERSVAAFVAALPGDPDHPFLGRKTNRRRFTGSWSVRLMREGFHINHIHGEGWISSAFYFALPPPDAGDPPHAGALQLGAPPVELDLDLPPRRIIKPELGHLILFPSSMWHGTLPFAGDAERITVAFDVAPA